MPPSASGWRPKRAAAAARSQVTRDRIMDAYHKLHPQYGFDKHKARTLSRQIFETGDAPFCMLS